jgi:hypothetical protein
MLDAFLVEHDRAPALGMKIVRSHGGGSPLSKAELTTPTSNKRCKTLHAIARRGSRPRALWAVNV